MLNQIIQGSLRHRLVVLMLAAIGMLAGLWALSSTPLDAIPDLSDAQVIVYTEYNGQSPRTVEDQITYPLTSSLVAVPGSIAVRGYSFFGYSLVYVLFNEGTDLYWARSRVTEILNSAQRRLPVGISPTLGPDGSGVGWVYEYALTAPHRSLAELRSLQDWYLKPALGSVAGVSEVASVGGFVKQYQVQIDPTLLRNYGISVMDLEQALRRSNSDVGGEVIESGETEYMIRGQGYLHGAQDIGAIPLRSQGSKGTALRIRDVAQVVEGPTLRRGLTELDGQGEVVAGVVVMRQGENALKTIANVKKKLAELKGGLPPDVEIQSVYDRSDLILRAVHHLRDKLLEEMLMVALVCVFFLLHVRSALVAVFTLPLAVLLSFFVMRLQGISANIMSLGGIAIAIGAMVDGAIILIENAHKHLEIEALKPAHERRDHWVLIGEAAAEVGPTLFFSLLVITVSFIPVFALGQQEGRLFKPLAYTKTYAMAASALLAITVIPVLMGYFIKGPIRPESQNPINRWLMAAYRPLANWALRRPKSMVTGAILLVLLTVFPFSKLGNEFMPPLFEGDLLYMPTTLPGISITKARELLQTTDRIIKTFPEVSQVFGKIGRAETATDPAGLDMIETTIHLKPESEWRKGMTVASLIHEMDQALQLPGLTNAWTMPIKNRMDMLNTGIKTPVGVKISGANLDTLALIGRQVEEQLRNIPGTASAFAERAVGGNYLDIQIRREEAARLGLNIEDIQEVIRSAIGGMPITTTVEGLERYAVSLRYNREWRDNLDALAELPIALPRSTGSEGTPLMASQPYSTSFGNLPATVPLKTVATLKVTQGPMVVRTEGSRPNSWVFVDLNTRDLGGYVERARQALETHLRLPTGYSLAFSGEYEYLARSRKTLAFIVPFTLLLIFLLLYLNTHSVAKSILVMAAVPFSWVGAIWILYMLGYNLSLAVWIGLIALAGLDAETGVIMLLYLDRSYQSWRDQRRLNSQADLKASILEGAVQRVRPKIMTATAILAGLIPILGSHGTGSDVMKRIAAPMLGGVITSVLLELAVYPALYYLARRHKFSETT